MVMVLDKSAVQINLVSLPVTVQELNFTLASKLAILLKQLSNPERRSVNMLARIATRARGSFDISTKNGLAQSISYKACEFIHKKDGYSYLL